MNLDCERVTVVVGAGVVTVVVEAALVDKTLLPVVACRLLTSETDVGLGGLKRGRLLELRFLRNEGGDGRKLFRPLLFSSFNQKLHFCTHFTLLRRTRI